MAPVTRKPIGVWFSIALVILLLSFWVGSYGGSAVARYWYAHHQQEQGTLPRPERLRTQSELDELDKVETLTLLEIIAVPKLVPWDKYLPREIKALENLQSRSNAPEIKSLIDLHLGLAYVRAALADEDNNNEEQAKKYMQSAQVLFKSLGWQDYSGETLKAVAKRERQKWELAPTKASEK